MLNQMPTRRAVVLVDLWNGSRTHLGRSPRVSWALIGFRLAREREIDAETQEEPRQFQACPKERCSEREIDEASSRTLSHATASYRVARGLALLVATS